MPFKRHGVLVNASVLLSYKVKFEDLICLCEDDGIFDGSLSLFEVEVHAYLFELGHLSYYNPLVELEPISASMFVHDFFEHEQLVLEVFVHNHNLPRKDCEVFFTVTLFHCDHLIGFSGVSLK